MKITPKFEYVTGSFDTDNVKMLCLANENHGKVELCIEENPNGFNFPIGTIKLHSRDLYVDFKETLGDAKCLGKEIARRWNEFPFWRDVSDEKYPIDKEVFCRMKSNGAIVSGYIYKDNGKYKVATSPNFHFEDYGDYECDLYMLIPEMPDNDTPKEEE